MNLPKIHYVILWVLMFLLACYDSKGQVQVHEEPFHKLVFENDWFRILQVDLEPGDTSAYHIHDQPIAYTCRKGGIIYLENLDGNSRSVELADDWIGSDSYDLAEPLIHRIANLGDTSFQLLAVEVRENKHRTEQTDLLTGQLLLKDNHFLIGSFKILPGSHIDLSSSAARVIILRTGDQVEYTNECLEIMNDEQWWMVQENDEMVNLYNPGIDTVNMVIIQIR